MYTLVILSESTMTFINLTEVIMKKIRIVIADHEKSYIESLSNYLRSSDEATRFISTYFTSKTALEQFLSSNEVVDVMLISPALYDKSLHIPKETSLIFLDDNEMKEQDTHRQSVYRYQRLNQLISNILAIYYENNQQAGKLLARSKQTEVLTVYSPLGGAGKSTVAANLSKQLAQNNLKVFYLNLELFNSTSIYFQSEEDNPSLQIFYFVKSESPQLLSKIESLKKYDAYSKVSYFDIAISADELLEISEDDVKRLINGIVGTGTYDYIVVDLDSSMHERNIAALKECDRIIWPITNDEQSYLKTVSFLAEEAKLIGKENVIKDKLLLIMNKFYGDSRNNVNDYNLTIDGYLPLVESWLGNQPGKMVLNNDLYNQELLAMIHERILVKEGNVVNVG